MLVLLKESFDNILSSIKSNFENAFQQRANEKAEEIHLSDLQELRIIGAGSYGMVKLVRHKTTGMTFALKQMLKATIGILQLT